MTYLSPGQQRPANPPHLPNPETALGYPPDRQGNEMRRTCSSRSPTEKDRILLYQWPVPTPSQLGITAASSSNNSSKVSGTGHGGADARTPHAESVAVTAFLQISHDRLGEYVGMGRRFGEGPTGNAMQGPLTANRRPSGQYAEEMENYQLAGSQVLQQGMGVGCKGESLDMMQKPGWVEWATLSYPPNRDSGNSNGFEISNPKGGKWKNTEQGGTTWNPENWDSKFGVPESVRWHGANAE
ncbi:uncharacterized protein TRIVIDRAFT_205579 [Trichoderma virens Gv29-8]|uniref:Uncharacterized protein n=1 Tax=Hypocrea virens (strain Gv29-8 / FGSC 10586) TaxID=413071 RepID=G9N7J1_HYPVG|nr:uncharacterized protein TRIVIDRAFT_205579 [Trichoderma virens Gv29-8]EHK16957.1 hypothetical protein TRIVIDRAFT_205579 [Trichoderma virens Gv29-8]